MGVLLRDEGWRRGVGIDSFELGFDQLDEAYNFLGDYRFDFLWLFFIFDYVHKVQNLPLKLGLSRVDIR